MHFIQSAAIPPVVKTAVSGVSTPSSVGQVFPADELARRDRADEVVTANAAVIEEWAQGAKFLVTWNNAEGQPRRCGFVSGGLSAESVVRLLGILTRNGITVVQVERVDA